MASRVLKKTIEKSALDKLNAKLLAKVVSSKKETTDIVVSSNDKTTYLQRANVGRTPANVITARNPHKIGLYKHWDHSELSGGEAASRASPYAFNYQRKRIARIYQP